jgi:hypothetical protein
MIRIDQYSITKKVDHTTYILAELGTDTSPAVWTRYTSYHNNAIAFTDPDQVESLLQELINNSDAEFNVITETFIRTEAYTQTADEWIND